MPEKRPSSPGPQWGPKKERGSGYASGGVPEEYNTPGYRGSDYPESSPKGFVSPEQIPDSGLNPEEELLAKEEGEIEEELPEFPQFQSAKPAQESYKKERTIRRKLEEEAGWSPEKSVSNLSARSSLVEEEGLKLQDKFEIASFPTIKEGHALFEKKLFSKPKRPDRYKKPGRKGKETIREEAA